MSTLRALLIAAASVALSAPLSAQALPITIAPDSRVMLRGTSNVHSWSCASSTIDATLARDDTAAALAFSASVPVRSLDCGRARMNQDMYRALRADQFGEIRYRLISYTVRESAHRADAFAVETVGDLTVAGVTKRVAVVLNAERTPDGVTRGRGTARLLMTDFGISPPTAFFGAIRTRNAIEVVVDARLRGVALVEAAFGR